MDKTEVERQLVTLCAAGSSQAWDRLVEEYGGLIYSVIQKYRLSYHQRRDLFVHVVEKLWADGARRLAAWEGRSRLATYLVTVTSRICTDYVKGRFHKEGTKYDSFDEYAGTCEYTRLSAETIAGPRRRALRAECGSILSDLLTRLSEKESALLKLFYWQRMKYSDIAILLGIPVSEVGKKLYRIRARLRSMLIEGGVKKIEDLWE